MCQKESGFIIRLTDALERRSKCILLKFSFCFPFQKAPPPLQTIFTTSQMFRWHNKEENIFTTALEQLVYRPSKRHSITNCNHLRIKSPNKKWINQASKFDHSSARWIYRNLKCLAWVFKGFFYIFLEIFNAWVLLINSLFLKS